MKQYDRYNYNDDYNGNSVFDRNFSKDKGSIGGLILLAIFVGILVGGTYLMETYPIITWILSFLYLTLFFYILYRILKFLAKKTRSIFGNNKSSPPPLPPAARK